MRFTQICHSDVTNENKHVRREINGQISHGQSTFITSSNGNHWLLFSSDFGLGSKFCSVFTDLPKLVKNLAYRSSSVKME